MILFAIILAIIAFFIIPGAGGRIVKIAIILGLLALSAGYKPSHAGTLYQIFNCIHGKCYTGIHDGPFESKEQCEALASAVRQKFAMQRPAISITTDCYGLSTPDWQPVERD